MRKTFEELNEQYVPNNTSTNFSNSTCRKRLLDRYIGEGNWSYIYSGRKVVAVEIVDDEVEEEIIEEVEVIEEETDVLNSEDPETVAEYKEQMEQLDMLVDEYENKLTLVRERIKYLESMYHTLGSVKNVFKGITFRSYSWINAVSSNADEILRRYNENKHREGINDALKEVAVKLATQAERSISFNDYRFKEYRRCEFRMYDRDFWNKCYDNVYSKYNKCTCEDYRDRFDINTKGVTNDIDVLKKVVAVCKVIKDTDEYKRIAKVLEHAKRYKARAEELLRTKDETFKEFCDGYAKYKARKQQEERTHRNSYNDDWFNQFFGGSSSRRTGRKYFTGCTTKQELKKRYRELAKKLHPDHGGSNDEFVAMKAEYDDLVKYAA